MTSSKHKKQDTLKGLYVLWQYIRTYQKELTILSILGIFSAFANGSVPYILGKFFDAIISQPNPLYIGGEAIAWWAILLALWAMVQCIAIASDWTNDRRLHLWGGQMYIDYRVNAFTRLILLPLQFHKEKRHGEVMEATGRAANGLYSIITYTLVRLAPQFISIIIGLGFMLSMNVPLALVLLAGVLSYVYVLVRIAPQSVALQRSVHKKWGEAYSAGSEALVNITTVKQSAAEENQFGHISRMYTAAHLLGTKIEWLWSNLNFSQKIIVVGTQLVIFILSVFSIMAGTLTLGELVAFNGYAAMVFAPFVTLGQNWQTVQNGLTALERAEKIFAAEPEVYEPKNGIKDIPLSGAIEFKNVSFSYGKNIPVLQDVSFTAKPGETVALVGESGAGKSTLIDLISGYNFPTKGTVSIDGFSTKKFFLKFLRNQIAIVPQEVVLFHDTIKKNIGYGRPRASFADIQEAARISHADHFIEAFPKKYETLVGERGVKLSVGQKQRIGIARAVLRDPKILILDEPTSALDSETERFVTDALNHVMQGRTTFIIAHRLSTVRRADKILVLDKGKIVEQGTHEELMQIENGNYRRRYELHIGLV